MSSDAKDKEVVQLVLTSFRRELSGLRSGFILRKLTGNAPTEGYARRFSALDERGRMVGRVLGVWHISQTETVSLPTTFTVPPPEGRSGMYYDRGTCDFVITADLKSVVVGWQVGPRFGRGFRYEVTDGEDGCIKLRMADTLWKS